MLSCTVDPVEGRTDLVVIDDPATLGAFSQWRHDEGFQVVTAANGREALWRVQDQAPDVIILDLQMSVMDGDITTGAIRHA